jgi:hypothetical protein
MICNIPKAKRTSYWLVLIALCVFTSALKRRISGRVTTNLIGSVEKIYQTVNIS